MAHNGCGCRELAERAARSPSIAYTLATEAHEMRTLAATALAQLRDVAATGESLEGIRDARPSEVERIEREAVEVADVAAIAEQLEIWKAEAERYATLDGERWENTRLAVSGATGLSQVLDEALIQRDRLRGSRDRWIERAKALETACYEDMQGDHHYRGGFRCRLCAHDVSPDMPETHNTACVLYGSGETG